MDMGKRDRDREIQWHPGVSGSGGEKQFGVRGGETRDGWSLGSYSSMKPERGGRK